MGDIDNNLMLCIFYIYKFKSIFSNSKLWLALNLSKLNYFLTLIQNIPCAKTQLNLLSDL